MQIFTTVLAILLTTSALAQVANVADLQQSDDMERRSLLLTRRHHEKQHSRLNKDRTIIGSDNGNQRTKRHHHDENDVVESVEKTQQESIAQHSIKVEGIAGGIEEIKEMYTNNKEMKEMYTNNKDEEVSPTTSDMPTLSPTWIDDSTLSPTTSDQTSSVVERNQDMHYSTDMNHDVSDIICRDDSGTSYLEELAVEIKSVQDELISNEGLTVIERQHYEDLLDTLLLLKTNITENIDIICPFIDFVLDAPEEKCASTLKSKTALLIELATAQQELIAAEGVYFTGLPLTGPEWPAVTAAQEQVLFIQRQINEIDTALAQCDLDTDVAIQEAVRETGAYAQFIACPFTPEQQENTVFIGQGCDGLDNNCNSVITSKNTTKRVDECAEDQVPPTIELRNDIPKLGFRSKEESNEWFQYNIEASDDCVNSLTVEIGEATSVGAADIRLFERQVTVFDPICKDETPEPGEKKAKYETNRTFEFIIDDIAPVISCGFDKRQDIFHVLDPDFVQCCNSTPPYPSGGRDDPLHISDESPLVNVQFHYNISDENPEPPPIPVNVKVTSNEIEYGKVRMVETVETENLGSPVNKVHRAKVFLAPYTCHDERGESVLCEPEIIEIDDYEEVELTRVYDIEVSATDEIGNVGFATCSVVVIPKHHPSTTSICGSSKSAKATHRTLLKGETKSGKAKGDSTKSVKGKESSWSSSKSSKSIKCLDHDNNDLRREYDLSKQRFAISSLDLHWDTSLDTTMEKPLEPISGKSGKSKSKGAHTKGKGQTSSFD